MPRYAITSKAGRFVAGHNNTGVGSPLILSEKAAAYELSLGTIELVPTDDHSPAKDGMPTLDVADPAVVAAKQAAPKRRK